MSGSAAGSSASGSAAGSSESAGSGGRNGSGGKPESAGSVGNGADGSVSEEGMKFLIGLLDEIDFAEVNRIKAERRREEEAVVKTWLELCHQRNQEKQEEKRAKKRRLAESCAAKIDDPSEKITEEEWDAYFHR